MSRCEEKGHHYCPDCDNSFPDPAPLLAALKLVLPVLESDHDVLNRSFLPSPTHDEALELEEVKAAIEKVQWAIAKAESQ